MEWTKVLAVQEDADKVVNYGRQLATVFHQYAATAKKIPYGFEGATNILDATITTLTQVLDLLKEETADLKGFTGKKLFSPEGISYVKQLVAECAKTLVKIEPIIVDSCLSGREYRAKKRSDKKTLAKDGPPSIEAIFSSMKIEEKDFLAKLEKMDYVTINMPIEHCMDRLYDLQLHLLLVFQVVTVGALSHDISSGKVDIKSIVTFHERVNRTARLVGIKAAKVAKKTKSLSSASSGSDSFSSSASDSDGSSIAFPKKKGSMGIKPKKKSVVNPLPWLTINPPGPPPPPGTRRLSDDVVEVIEEPVPAKAIVPAPETVNPPAYSESHKSSPSITSTTPAPSTLLGTMPETPTSKVSTISVTDEKPKHIEEKLVLEDEKAPADEPMTKVIIKPTTPEPRLFKTKSNGFGFKLRTLFRSKESLAAEMKKALSDTDSHLMAFVIQGYNKRLVPHSAFHSLETTHMRTILSQLNDDTWYKTFTSLNQTEHNVLHRIMYPYVSGKTHERQVVVLKLLNENKLSAWTSLLKQGIQGHHLPEARSVLAIVREQLINGEPLVANHRAKGSYSPSDFVSSSKGSSNSGSPTTTVPEKPVVPIVPNVRPPPLPYTAQEAKISDLKGPPYMQTTYQVAAPHQSPPPPMPRPPVGPPPGRQVHPGPPGPPRALGARPPGPPGPPGLPANNGCSIRISDTTPLTDYEATLALTTYNEYTVRICESIQPDVPRSWTRVATTLESSEKKNTLKRLEEFEASGGSVVKTKMRLSDEQNDQVTRLMDELKAAERDNRFEWFWVELSLFDKDGEMIDHKLKGPDGIACKATLMHLIAKRCLRPHCRPIEVYNALMRGPPGPPPFPRPTPRPPMPVTISPPRIIKVKKNVKNRGRYSSDSSSGSDSDSSLYSSSSDGGTSVGHVRRRLRRLKTRKGTGNKYHDRWASDSDSEDEEAEDPMKIKVEFKKGDDVVKKLLDAWTPRVEDKGKGKAIE